MSIVGKWGYKLHEDAEYYQGAADSAEQAAADSGVKPGETVTVGQYRDPIRPEDVIDVEPMLEDVRDHEDYGGEWAEDALDCSDEQQTELTDDIRRVFGEWLDRHTLRPTFGIVEEQSVKTFKATGGE